MNRSTPRSLLLTIAAAVLLAASVAPASAGFIVAQRGKTTTVTQTEAGSLFVTRSPGGDFEVSDGGPVSAYPGSENLVVRTFETAMSYPTVILNSALPGTLTLELRGPSDATVRGGVPSIGRGLKVKGGDAGQLVRLGRDGAPIVIEGNATFDLRDGDDEIDFETGGVVLGSLKTKGVNQIEAPTVSVGGSFSMNVGREAHAMELLGIDLTVGKSFSAKGGSGSDDVLWFGGSAGGNVQIDLADAPPAGQSQLAQLDVSSIGGNLKYAAGTGSASMLFASSGLAVKGSVSAAARSTSNFVDFSGSVGGTSIAYAGGAGRHSVSLRASAPRAKATVVLGEADDELKLDGSQLARLTADFGPGTDLFVQGSFLLPPGSKLLNLP